MKGHETKSNKVYDYCAVLYPEGLISSDNFILFDKENIDTVIFKEYESILSYSFLTAISDASNIISCFP